MNCYLLIFLFLAASSIVAAPVELIPGLVSYDPPDFFDVGQAHADPGDNSFAMQSRPIQLTSKYGGIRELNVSVRGVGSTIGEGKHVTMKPVSFDELKTIMAATVISDRATNSPKVEGFQFAGRKALRVKQVVWIPQLEPGGASLIFDFVWVPLDSNRVLEIKPVGRTEELLKSVWDSLNTFKILAK
jgi:hypothetical protein